MSYGVSYKVVDVLFLLVLFSLGMFWWLWLDSYGSKVGERVSSLFNVLFFLFISSSDDSSLSSYLYGIMFTLYPS